MQTPPVVAIKRLKDPPTWLKVATTLEKPSTPTHDNILKMPQVSRALPKKIYWDTHEDLFQYRSKFDKELFGDIQHTNNWSIYYI